MKLLHEIKPIFILSGITLCWFIIKKKKQEIWWHLINCMFRGDYHDYFQNTVKILKCYLTGVKMNSVNSQALNKNVHLINLEKVERICKTSNKKILWTKLMCHPWSMNGFKFIWLDRLWLKQNQVIYHLLHLITFIRVWWYMQDYCKGREMDWPQSWQPNKCLWQATAS